METKRDLLDYLKGLKSAVTVLATADEDGQPASSPVFYAVSDADEIIVSSEIQTRKWRNLKENSKVALVFGAELGRPSIQCEGTAQLFSDGREFEALGEYYYNTVPEARKFSQGTMGLIRIIPERFRVVTYDSAGGPIINEVE
jgi:general stress protein 26